MGRKRHKQNVVQLADQVASPLEMALDQIPKPLDRILAVTIRWTGGAYICEIHRRINDHPHIIPFPIAWRPADFEAELFGLAEHAKLLSAPGPVAPRLLQNIALRGKVLFDNIFPTKEARQIIRTVCEGEGKHKILFFTDRFTMCWPLLYLGENLSEIDVGMFLGMRATIVRILASCVSLPSQNYREDKPAGSPVHVNYAWDKSFDQIRLREKPYIVKLETRLDEPRISVREVPALHANDSEATQVPALFGKLNEHHHRITADT